MIINNVHVEYLTAGWNSTYNFKFVIGNKHIMQPLLSTHLGDDAKVHREKIRLVALSIIIKFNNVSIEYLIVGGN